MKTMQSLSDDERRAVLGEVLSDELKAILEYVKDVPALQQAIRELRVDVSDLKTDMKIVRAATTDTSRQVNSHERRLAHLEATS